MTLSTSGQISEATPEGSRNVSRSASAADGITLSPRDLPDVGDLRRRFLTVRSVAGSPLRDDLDVSLLELDGLLAALTEIEPALTYLHFEIEAHRSIIIEALQSGYEI